MVTFMAKRPLLFSLVILSLFLPPAMVVLHLASKLLGAMGDRAGGAVLVRISQGFGIIWILGLVILLIVLSIGALVDAERRSSISSDDDH